MRSPKAQSLVGSARNLDSKHPDLDSNDGRQIVNKASRCQLLIWMFMGYDLDISRYLLLIELFFAILRVFLAIFSYFCSFLVQFCVKIILTTVHEDKQLKEDYLIKRMSSLRRGYLVANN